MVYTCIGQDAPIKEDPMPWKETRTMDERVRFAMLLKENLYTMSELCERFGISRPTGYKWRSRYLAEGFDGLRELDRSPHHSPLRTSLAVEQALVELCRKKPTWGPKKLIQRLAKLHPDWVLPGPTTGWRILRRHDLIAPRRRRSRSRHPGRPYVEMAAPNDVWTADYKGHFRMGDGRYCFL
jgi:putative transposase